MGDITKSKEHGGYVDTSPANVYVRRYVRCARRLTKAERHWSLSTEAEKPRCGEEIAGRGEAEKLHRENQTKELRNKREPGDIG